MRKPVITEGHSGEQIGYLAGIFDGEGTIGIGKSHPDGRVSYSLVIQIATMHQKTIFLLYQYFGGNFCLGKSTKMAYWYCCGSNVGKILKLIIPYLIEKKEQTELALNYLEVIDIKSPGGACRTDLERELQETYHLMMKTLKKENKSQNEIEEEIEKFTEHREEIT